jgi:hypothetical protein
MTNKSIESLKEFGPLKTKRRDDDLNDDACVRLNVLLNTCKASANKEGWRKLAMYLVSQLPEFQFERDRGDKSTVHVPFVRIEFLRRSELKLSIAKAVQTEAGLGLKEKRNWSDKDHTKYETLLREYRKERSKTALFTSTIRRGEQKMLRAWFAIEQAFLRLESQCKLEDGTVNRDDLEPRYE